MIKISTEKLYAESDFDYDYRMPEDIDNNQSSTERNTTDSSLDNVKNIKKK